MKLNLEIDFNIIIIIISLKSKSKMNQDHNEKKFFWNEKEKNYQTVVNWSIFIISYLRINFLEEWNVKKEKRAA